MKQLARFALIIPASALVLLCQGPGPGYGPGPRFGFGGPGGPHAEKVVTGVPYSGTITESRQQTLSDGNQISTQSQVKVYRDADGRVRRETTRTMRNGQTATFITIYDPVAGFEAQLNPTKLTAMKHTLPTTTNATATTAARPPALENAAQVTTADLGASTIESLAATGKRTTFTIPAGEEGNAEPIQTVREVWTSTVLQVPVQVTTTNPQFGTTKMVLSNVTQGTQDATLFQIPANYKVSTATGRHGGPPPSAPPAE